VRTLPHEALAGKRPFEVGDLGWLSYHNYLIEVNVTARARRTDQSPASRYLRIVQGYNHHTRQRPMPIINLLWGYGRMYKGQLGRPNFGDIIIFAKEDLCEALDDDRGWLKVVPGVVAAAA
jgi:hypothetical protein